MCGLVGVAGSLEFQDEALIKRLLLLDYFRGTDSTGLAAVRKTGEVHIAKMASHPIDLFDTKSFEKALSGYQSKAFIGHNRAATKGKINGNNAHPYEYGHIVGAHNGTLDQSSWRALNDALGYDTDVDSMAVIACIEKLGIEETVKLMCGAWALVWYDLKENTLNFLRNKERPMWFSYSSDFEKVFWASEWPMIQAATEMAGSNSYDLYSDKQDYSFFPTEEDVLYSYDINKMAEGGYKGLPEVKGKKLQGKAPAPVVSYQGGHNPFTRTPGTSITTTANKTTTGSSSDIPFLTVLCNDNEPFGSFLTKEKFGKMSGNKCMYCYEPVDFTDEGVVVFEGMNDVLCGECSGHTTSRYLATPTTYHEQVLKTQKGVK